MAAVDCSEEQRVLDIGADVSRGLLPKYVLERPVSKEIWERMHSLRLWRAALWAEWKPRWTGTNDAVDTSGVSLSAVGG